jgi:2-iminobutanoate/2-iminopropanoate deaminase
MIKKFNSSLMPRPVGSYSHVARVDRFAFISAGGSIDVITGKIIGVTIEEQTEYTLTNLKKLVEELRASFDDVIKIGIYLKDINDFNRFDSVYKTFFPKGNFPARTTIGCNLWEGLLIEIDAVIAIAEER